LSVTAWFRKPASSDTAIGLILCPDSDRATLNDPTQETVIAKIFGGGSDSDAPAAHPTACADFFGVVLGSQNGFIYVRLDTVAA
jgi:hypothetical protein